MKETGIKIVPSAWLQREDRRLDCRPYLSGAIEARLLIDALPFKIFRLHQLTKGGYDGVFHAGREGRSYVLDEKHGAPFLSSTDILAADLSFVSLISKKQAEATPKFTIERGWTLITRSGTVGRMAFARSQMHGMSCSEHVLRVVPDPDKIAPGYLFAYLSSRFGVPLIAGGTYGSIIQHIEPVHVAELPVPRLGEEIEKETQTKVAAAATLLDEFQSQLRMATFNLFSAVNLQDITPGAWHKTNPDLSFVRRIVSAESFRALNFNPRFQELCQQIRTRPWRTLGSLCLPGTLSRGGRLKRIDAEPEYAYRLIGQREIFWVRPEGRWIAKKGAKDFVYPPGTILIAATGTLAESELYSRAEFVWAKSSQNAYAENFLRVSADEALMPPGCLFAFLRSETAFRMFRSVSMGTKLQIPNPSLLNNLPIPFPDETTRRKIHEIVIDAYEKRDRAIRLEDEAVQLVERAILREN